MPLEALIFDVDGTLAETEELHRVAFNAAFEDAALDWHWDRDLYKCLLRTAGGKERISRYVVTNLRLAPSPDIDVLIAALHRRKTTVYGEMVARGCVSLRPGVREVIEEAGRQGLRLAIATTTSRSNVGKLLQATLGPDAQSRFEVIATGDSAAQKKPAPAVYLDVLSALRLEANTCLALEDSENGLRAALAASIPTLILPSSYCRDEDFTGAAAVAAELPELVGVSRSGGALTASPPALLAALRLVHAHAPGREPA